MGLVSFERQGNLGSRSYFLANRNCFFNRFANSGFSNKWAGLWKRERKFLEFFAVKVGDVWLSPDNCSRIGYNFASAAHTYDIGTAQVNEKIFIPERSDALVVELSSTEPLDAELKLAVNIRKRVENRTSRAYVSASRARAIDVSNELGSLSLRMLSGRWNFEPAPSCEEHAPGGEPQNYFTPGKIKVIGDRIAFALMPSLVSEKAGQMGNYIAALAEKEEAYGKLSSGRISSDNAILVRGFESSVLATELLKKNICGKPCFYAGLPWFQQFWARDMLWALPALLSLGYFKDAKSCLSLFAGCSTKAVPSFISETEGFSSNAIDATLLWIIGMENYVLSSGDVAFLDEMACNLMRLLDFILDRDIDSDGFIEHDMSASETWMDTLRRQSRAVDIEALFYRALASASRMLGLLGTDAVPLAARVSESMKKMEDGFDSRFFCDGFYLDRIPSVMPDRTANALVPILCGLGRHQKEILDAIETEAFTTPVGVRCHGLGEGFSNGYHTGMVWSLTTAWASAAEFSAGRSGKGWEYLKTLIAGNENNVLGAVGECWDSLSLENRGCGLQLWGSASIPMLVDRFMLGIRPDASRKCVFVNPSMPPEINRVERELSIGGIVTKLVFQKGNDGISVSSSNNAIRVIGGDEQRTL